MPAYGGSQLFGRSVSIRMEPNPSKKVYTEFFGLDGLYMQFGGSRGRTFFVQGLLAANSDAALTNAIALMLSYDDGVARELVDTRGLTWPQVVFDHWSPGERFLHGNGSALLEYRMTFTGLI